REALKKRVLSCDQQAIALVGKSRDKGWLPILRSPPVGSCEGRYPDTHLAMAALGDERSLEWLYRDIVTDSSIVGDKRANGVIGDLVYIGGWFAISGAD